MFYANVPKIQRLKVNQMLKVGKPEDEVVTALKSLHSVTFNPEVLKVKDDTLGNLFNTLNQPQVTQNQRDFVKTVLNYIQGHEDEEEIDFGDQSKNPSIFMNIPVDERLASRFFDIEIATLLPSILTKEKLYEVVKKLNILAGRSEAIAKQESITIINNLETQTTYADCMPMRQPTLIQEIRAVIGRGAV